MRSLACWLLLRLFRVLPFGSWSVSPPSVVIKLPLVMSCRQVVMFLARMCFFQSYPERFYFEGLLEFAGASVPTVQYLPIYFGNVCLRFLPVSAQALLGCMGWRRLFRKRIFSKKCYPVVFIYWPIILSGVWYRYPTFPGAFAGVQIAWKSSWSSRMLV